MADSIEPQSTSMNSYENIMEESSPAKVNSFILQITTIDYGDFQDTFHKEWKASVNLLGFSRSSYKVIGGKPNDKPGAGWQSFGGVGYLDQDSFSFPLFAAEKIHVIVEGTTACLSPIVLRNWLSDAISY